MNTYKQLLRGVLATCIIMSGLVYAQGEPGAIPAMEGFGGWAGAGGEWSMDNMQKMMVQPVKEQLGFSDTEWQIIEPRLLKVISLNSQTRGNTFGMGMMTGFGGMQSFGMTQHTQDLSPVDKALQDLRSTLDKSNVSATEIKEKLSALRKAREKAQQDLTAAQAELKKLLTTKQEAELILMGYLQ